MIFNPLIVVASELGLNRSLAPRTKEAGGEQIVRAFRRVNESGIGSVIVDSVNDAEAAAAVAGMPVNRFSNQRLKSVPSTPPSPLKSPCAQP